jgi:hypothetical protein
MGRPHLIEAVGKKEDWLLKNLAKIPIEIHRSEQARKQYVHKARAELEAAGLDLRQSRRRRR